MSYADTCGCMVCVTARRRRTPTPRERADALMALIAVHLTRNPPRERGSWGRTEAAHRSTR